MAEPPSNDIEQNGTKNAVDYQLLDRLVDENPTLSDEQILQKYQQHKNSPQVTVALLSEDLNDATKVILASALPDHHDPKSTHSQAQYRIEKRIDSGGQSHVYLAHRNDGTYQNTVVIKVLNQSIEGDTQKQQLMAEMQILADLKHPNIVSILDAGIDEQQRPWLMLEFIAGEHIDQFINKHQLSPDQLSELFIQIAKALKYIHHNQVVHADIKPANILVKMLDDQPQAVIIDFGIATTDNSQQATSCYVFATPAFASPEQLNHELTAVDHRSDIYSMGQLMQYLIENQSQAHPNILWINQDLAAIIEQCTASLPEKRYQDMQSLILDLQRHRAGDVVSVRPTDLGQKLSRTLSKHKWLFIMLLFIVCVAGFFINHSIQQNKQNLALVQGAESSQHYWQQADDISNQSRLIYALPKRNIEPDFKRLNDQFDRLLNQMLHESAATQKLAFAAMADAAISLGRHETAHELLIKANSNNPLNAAIKFKLGKSYLMLYQNEVQSLQNYAQMAQRQEQRQRLQNKYFVPALNLFDAVEDHVNNDPLISSLLHYFEGRYDQALQQLESSDSQLLWPIERLLLAAQITQEQANQLLLKSKTDQAIILLEQALGSLSQAKQIARSHPMVHQQLCQTESLLLQLNQNQLVSRINACDELLEVLPHTANAILVAADAYAQLAKSWLDRGQSPAQLLSRSRLILDHAWSAEPKKLQAHAEQLKGHLLNTEGKWHLYSDQEFMPFFKQAIKHHQSAVDRLPNNYSAQLELATAWYNLANNTSYDKEQTERYFERATERLSSLTQHADSTEFLPAFLVRVLTDHAYIRYQNGLPADQQLNQANQWLDQTQAKSPESQYAQLAAATLYWTYTDYRVLQGIDPEPYLSAAIDAFDQVIVSEASQWTNRYNQISVMLSGVTYYLELGQPQSQQLEHIKEKLELLESWISASINLDSHWGYYHNMLAYNQLLLNENPSNNLKAAWQRNTSCADSPIDGSVCYAQMATSLVTESKWNASQPTLMIDHHQNYLPQLQLGIKQHPNNHILLARFGQYLWLNSQLKQSDLGSKLTALNQARAHLLMAIAGNPLLAEKFSNDVSSIEAVLEQWNKVSD
ncbi:serine/threonine-protein kinase [Marinicella litoralis]|uniref:Protein kinase-like protein n=1 Tax=Marinicella litoralis TaxID=644220 RepID=A0A4R6XAI6_9GAMM|nr:serine/threonine-protein kinase [Marinicella litoralis]TDR14640.1 protein kinase-like protein [Marinicella litoralis]